MRRSASAPASSLRARSPPPASSASSATPRPSTASFASTRDQALAQADAADRALAAGEAAGPLHGVPLAHKDMFYRAGVVCTCGSKIRRDFVPDRTATVLRRLDHGRGPRRRGAQPLGVRARPRPATTPTSGRAATPGAPRTSRAARRADRGRRWPPASCSGRSARIREARSDCPPPPTASSASSPTQTRVSRHAMMGLSFSLDNAGPLTRTVRDAGPAPRGHRGPRSGGRDEQHPAGAGLRGRDPRPRRPRAPGRGAPQLLLRHGGGGGEDPARRLAPGARRPRGGDRRGHRAPPRAHRPPPAHRPDLRGGDPARGLARGPRRRLRPQVRPGSCPASRRPPLGISARSSSGRGSSPTSWSRCSVVRRPAPPGVPDAHPTIEETDVGASRAFTRSSPASCAAPCPSASSPARPSSFPPASPATGYRARSSSRGDPSTRRPCSGPPPPTRRRPASRNVPRTSESRIRRHFTSINTLHVDQQRRKPVPGKRRLPFRQLLVGAAAVALVASIATTPARAGGTLRVGMTAADIPLSWGQPDQGFEGFPVHGPHALRRSHQLGHELRRRGIRPHSGSRGELGGEPGRQDQVDLQPPQGRQVP